MTIKEITNLAKEKIGYINAKILITYLLGKDMQYIVANQNEELKKEEEIKYLDWIKKVEKGIPVQYITNKQEFMGLPFFVNEKVLIPQPDTEILVEEAIKYASKMQKCKILDLCTGSGAIGISVKKYVPSAIVYVSDISREALEIAEKNAKELSADINFIESDMFENITETFDIVVTNPPYIKTDVISTLAKDVQNEPKIALDGGQDGLKFYRIIREKIEKYLNENGTLLMEIGYDQGKEVNEMFENSIKIKDYAGLDRVVVWKHSQKK